MKTIKQKGENDCGVACVAMLTGVEYDEARKVIYADGRAKLTKTKDLHDALIKLGREPMADRRKPFGSKTEHDLDTDALVFVEIKDSGAKHWIVWDAEAKRVRDPWKAKYGRDLCGYLPVK